jgi:MFS family permease
VIPFAVVHDGLHRRSGLLGVLGAFHGAGAIAGGLGAGRMIGRAGETRTFALALALGSVGMLAFTVTTLGTALVASLLFGCCLAGVIACWVTLIQRGTPPELRGRAAAAGEAIAGLPYVAAIALGSAAATVVDYRLLTLVAAAGLAAASARMLRGPAGAQAPDLASDTAPVEAVGSSRAARRWRRFAATATSPRPSGRGRRRAADRADARRRRGGRRSGATCAGRSGARSWRSSASRRSRARRR